MQRGDEKDLSLQQQHPLAPLPSRQTGSQSQPQPQPQQPKALRFVTNSGAPLPKRRRIGAACQTCRRRKTACSGERPVCDTCKQNKVQCLGYNPEPAAAPTNKRALSDTDAARNSVAGSARMTGQGKRKSSSPSQGEPGRHWNASKTASNTSGGPSLAFTTESQSQTTASDPKSLFSGPRNRMPYFRWLGPTAIMPGFKQMVVKVKRQDVDVSHSSTDGGSIRSPPLPNPVSTDRTTTSTYSTTPTTVESDVRIPPNLPFYDTSPMPPSELITHLANTFFSHLGCNYPFLQRRRFLRDLEEKHVDAILVDAVCALAARFSTHPLLTQALHEGETKVGPAEYGHAFAQRAKVALIDTFTCPSVAAAQAALLLAYNEFGEQRDSGLWMYLGISIRLAQDLGLHKLEGLRYVGRDGPIPKMVKRQGQNITKTSSGNSGNKSVTASSQAAAEQSPDDQHDKDETRAVEQERVDTFWAIFFLDRVVSSGTGRRGTLRDADIEISFPSLSETYNNSEWPAPFPALIRIVHLYGRVADLLNSIKEPSDVTADTPRRLAAMETQVTNFYQGLSPRLHFDAVSFQHYMKTGEGTNFVLLHFWFHMLIVLLHQPTLLKTFEGHMLQLFPNSQQLSMSSAKTIADILSYSQLMDAKASLGNPFTTQPIYIAACAFLKETAEQTATSSAQSRASSPSRHKDTTSESTASADGNPSEAIGRVSTSVTAKADSPKRRPTGTELKSQLAKHTLLATAASQHYQLCYKALQSLETYWAGTKYILTILDQKFQGVEDPQLYTTEEGESSMEQPRPEPAFTSPGWRRKLSWGPYAASSQMPMQSPFWPSKGLGQPSGSPGGADHSKAIGWTLTGTMDSPSTNLACHYASGNGDNSNVDPKLTSLSSKKYGSASGQMANTHPRTGSTGSHIVVQDNTAGLARPFNPSKMVVAGPDIDSPLGLGSVFSQQASAQPPANTMGTSYQQQPNIHPQMHPGHNTVVHNSMAPPYVSESAFIGGQSGQFPLSFMDGDMMIESQDVDVNDMSMLGLEMMPWFDSYPTHDFGSYPYDPHTTGGAEGAAK